MRTQYSLPNTQYEFFALRPFLCIMSIMRPILALIIFLALPVFSSAGEAPSVPETLSVPGPTGEVINIHFSYQPKPTDREGVLKEAVPFYFMKFNFRGNFFSVNIPAEAFKRMDIAQKKELVSTVAEVFNTAFSGFTGVFGNVPENFIFNVTFGKTRNGEAFNRVYLVKKISNIYLDSLPFDNRSEALSVPEAIRFFHEIGHGLFGIAVGNMTDPRVRSIEEGFIDYLAEEEGASYYIETQAPLFKFDKRRVMKMEGLAQLDVDASIWGRDAVLSPGENKGYLGFTHHFFGREFIKTFVQVFGKDDLPDLLKRLKMTEDKVPIKDDLGTQQVLRVFGKLGYSGEKVKEFEEKLHENLKKNVFGIDPRQAGAGTTNRFLKWD